jgi:hypothetical protein
VVFASDRWAEVCQSGGAVMALLAVDGPTAFVSGVVEKYSAR